MSEKSKCEVEGETTQILDTVCRRGWWEELQSSEGEEEDWKKHKILQILQAHQAVCWEQLTHK